MSKIINGTLFRIDGLLFPWSDANQIGKIGSFTRYNPYDNTIGYLDISGKEVCVDLKKTTQMNTIKIEVCDE